MGVIGRIHPIHVREVWPHEAHDFTTWLQLNIDIVADQLQFGIDPESVRREVEAGDFSVDIVAADDEGRKVIIENQLSRSNHDHLGKLLTYRAMLEADVVVWIVTEARPEHSRVFSWLNDHTPVDAYLLKLEAVRIGDSMPAPLLTTIVEPSEVLRRMAQSEGEEIERHSLRAEFWEQVIRESTARSGRHAGLNARRNPYISTTIELRGVNLTFGVREHTSRVMVWIERGSSFAAYNEAVFEHLKSHREEIEGDFGHPLEWEAKEGNRSRKLISPDQPGGWRDGDDWNRTIPHLVGMMESLADSVQPHLKALKASGRLDELLDSDEPNVDD